MKMLLLSNGRKKSEKLLAFALSEIKNFIGTSVEEILFIPYARVLMDEIEYTEQVKDAFSETEYKIKMIANGDEINNIKKAKCILVGGGNTFNLLDSLINKDFLLLRPQHNSVAKEKCDKIILIEAWIAANSGLLARFTTKSRMILAIFTRHLSYAEVSN